MRPPTQHLRFTRPHLPPGLEELRLEVREFLAEELERGTWERGGKSWGEYNPELTRGIAACGWVGMTFPKQYGGHERTFLERYVVTEELLAAGSPCGAHWVADRQSGPLLLRYGTEEQRQRYLPPIVRGESYFCIGMSEPDSGSDLASIRTRAEKVDGGWSLSGTKIWTSWAHHCHYIIVLCRTEPRSENRHAGMSQLLVDLHAPGVSIRPIDNLTGRHEFNEIVFDQVFVSDADLIGEPGSGWHQVTSELAYERSGPERFLTNFHLLRETVARLDDGAEPATAREIGSVVSRLAALRAAASSIAGQLEAGETPAVEASLVKDRGTLLQQEIPQLARRIAHAEHFDDLGFEEQYGWWTLLAPAYTIQGGTTEILRGIIARGLGLR
ncbi:MAG TPA: acyl-CoA dehydrogenase family protein [Thermoanaerobaculia bacterium]|nr:acyl-CoA dehydrogenase family protein [Thermoanaerobaculia bacterium]